MEATISRILKYVLGPIARFALYPIYFLSGLIPRRPDLWVFGSWGGYRFADNSAAFFVFCTSEMRDAVELVWISRRYSIVSKLRSRGFKSHWIWSPKGIFCSVRAGVFIFDCFSKDINFWLSRKAEKINLWSGVPLKTFERDIDNPYNRYYRLFHGSLPERCVLRFLMPWHVERCSFYICTSPAMQAVLCSAFDVVRDKVLITGYPRNDILFHNKTFPIDLPRNLRRPFEDAIKSRETIFIYLPTFRDSNRPFISFDWTRLDEFLASQKAWLFYKFHPTDNTKVDTNSQRIIGLSQDIDVYEILAKTDVLISDYSSIIFDYMLLDKPIIFYTPDLEEFVSSSRALKFDFADIAVGPLCQTFEDLLTAMSTSLQGVEISDIVLEHRRKIVRRFHSHIDGHACQRVLAAIDEKVLKSP